MEFHSFDGRGDAEYSGVNLVSHCHCHVYVKELQCRPILSMGWHHLLKYRYNVRQTNSLKNSNYVRNHVHMLVIYNLSHRIYLFSSRTDPVYHMTDCRHGYLYILYHIPATQLSSQMCCIGKPLTGGSIFRVHFIFHTMLVV